MSQSRINFATAALNGLLSNPEGLTNMLNNIPNKDFPKVISQMSFLIADAMMEEAVKDKVEIDENKVIKT